MVSIEQLALSDEVKKAIKIAQATAKEFSNAKFSAAHLLKAILHKDVGLISFLEVIEKDNYYMEEWAEVRIEAYPKSSKILDNPPADEYAQVVIKEAENISLKLSKDNIDPLCVLISLATPGVGFSYEQLKSFNLTHTELLDKVVEKSDFESAMSDGGDEKGTVISPKKQNALLKYCNDLSSLTQQNKLDPVLGRDKETRMIAEILGRRSKSNVLIIGDLGVGKTALVNGFAQQTQNTNTKVFELNFGSLIAGASYKGEVEDRLKSIIEEIKQFEKAILFIDEIHMIIDKQGGASGAVNYLIPELDKGLLTIIGTTSIDNYTRFIESDDTLNQQFELIKLEEPSLENNSRILSHIITIYEKHHDIITNPKTIEEAVRLSKRFMKERSLPGAAIDLIDRGMAALRLTLDNALNEISQLKEELNKVFTNDSLSETQILEELKWLNGQIKDKTGPLLLAKLENDFDINNLESTEEIRGILQNQLDELEQAAKTQDKHLSVSDLAAVVSLKTGIPMGKLQTQERDRLLNIETHLKKRVVGQDHAIASIAESIRESRSGLNKAGQPIGSFFFLGPTGTGKTELAKTLAEFLFNDESSLIRFDMSEFKEEHSAALLYGAPPGYVGYEEGGLLVNKIRQKPYAIVLFDEIEKAHASVFDIFLQILDEGKLHDRLGKEGDFSNAVILFTSNIGSSYIVDEFNKGNIPPSNELIEIMEKYFRPEFLGRLTEIIPFAPISEKNVVKIFEIHLKSLLKSLELMGVQLNIEDDAKKHLAISGFTPKYGARPLIGVIRNKLRRPLSKMIISNEIGKGSEIALKLNKDRTLIWETK